jgi:hypothetical protein
MSQVEIQEKNTRELSQVISNIMKEGEEKGKREAGQRIAYISPKREGPNQTIQVRNGNDRTIAFIRGEIVYSGMLQTGSREIGIKPDGEVTLFVDRKEELKDGD